MWAYRWRLALLTILTAGRSAHTLVMPLLTRSIIDVAYPARDLRLFWTICAVMVAVNLGVVVIHGVHGYLSTYLGNLLEYRIRMRVFRALSRLPMSYVETHQTGMLLERCSRDAELSASMITELVPQVGALALTTIATILLMMKLSFKVTALVMVCVPAYGAINIVLTRRMRRWQRRLRTKAEELTTTTMETIEGMPTAKVFGAQKWLQRTYRDLLRDKIAIAFGAWRTQFTYGRLSWGVAYGWGVALSCGAWYLVFRDRLQLGQAVAFGMYVPLLLRPVEGILGIYRTLMASSVSIQRISEVLTAVSNNTGQARLHGPFLAKSLALDNVSFAYPGQPCCLHDVSLTARPGEALVIIGPSGSGKTTLLRLLAGMYECTRGRLVIDQRDTTRIAHADYQRHIAFVMAESVFFSATILDNMRIAAPHAEEEQLARIAGALGADEFIKTLPQGYHTLLGVGGVRLSSGQMQRLALMRALLKGPKLLLLDEVTSAMDVASERTVIEGIADLKPEGCVTVMTAHRLSLTRVPWVTRVLVLSRGMLVEQGPPEELYVRGEEYRRLMDLAGYTAVAAETR